MSRHVRIVGILNVTPDSYYDGGTFLSVEDAVRRARELSEQGADIVEIGGESTGPNSVEVTLEEEWKRVIPVIDAIRRELPAVSLSIDTYKSEMARAAMERGVVMVNDVTAGRSDPTMFAVVAKSNALLVLMYAKDPTPRTTIEPTEYTDVISTVKTFLAERKEAAVAAGVDVSRIVLDPGLGHFVSSDATYSFQILARLNEFQSLGCPVFVSPSRKSFLAGKENLSTADRLPGTIAASVIAAEAGASYIRTHDVSEVRRALEILESLPIVGS